MLVLADTSVWIDHFRRGNADLARLLADGRIATHPHVVGELACGQLSRRRETIELLSALPSAVVAMDGEVFRLIEERRLSGRGLGWTDAHLLAASLLSGQRVWTLDRGLAIVARELALEYAP